MILVIDYGVGNVRSVTNAVRHIGCDTNVSCRPEDIENADGIILPGVGACAYAMKALGPLADVIRKVALDGKPLLGICLGFELLFDESCEHGKTKCIGLISGKVVPLPAGQRIPHMGWNLVNLPQNMELFEGLDEAVYFPFAHSYYAEVTDPQATVAYTHYGTDVCASVQKKNIFGCQFHPEKSGKAGLDILRNFQRICERGK